VELSNELLAELAPRAIRDPVGVVDLTLRPQVGGRVGVAVQAPLHRQRRDRVHLAHRVDVPMALVAADPVREVRGVVEVDELRELVDARPSENQLARTGARRSDSCQTWLWQFMQTEVGGAPAYFDRSAS
jgi:hypothetical protein